MTKTANAFLAGIVVAAGAMVLVECVRPAAAMKPEAAVKPYPISFHEYMQLWLQVNLNRSQDEFKAVVVGTNAWDKNFGAQDEKWVITVLYTEEKKAQADEYIHKVKAELGHHIEYWRKKGYDIDEADFTIERRLR